MIANGKSSNGSVGSMNRDHISQRNGKPAEKQGRKVTDLRGTGFRIKPVPKGGWTASCSLKKKILIQKIE
jgi:hypothetical protein